MSSMRSLARTMSSSSGMLRLRWSTSAALNSYCRDRTRPISRRAIEANRARKPPSVAGASTIAHSEFSRSI